MMPNAVDQHQESQSLKYLQGPIIMYLAGVGTYHMFFEV